jgi:uncharacterized membrane protein
MSPLATSAVVFMPWSESSGFILTSIEWAALGVEVLAIVVIVAGVVKVALARGTYRHVFQPGKPGAYEGYKHQLGKPLLLGLDLLLAGDVIKTVALEPTLPTSRHSDCWCLFAPS